MIHWRKGNTLIITITVIGASLVLILGGCSSDSDNETENIANNDVAMETVNPKQDANVTEITETNDRPQPPDGAGGRTMFASLVEEGVISQDQMEQLMQFMKENMDRQNPGNISQVFYDAAAEGIVTSEQADQIVIYMGSTGLGRPQ